MMIKRLIKWALHFFEPHKQPKPEVIEIIRPMPQVKRARPRKTFKAVKTVKEKEMAAKPGLYANIHAKQERIERQKAEGEPVEKMRKPGTKGAPTKQAFVQSAKTAKKAK
jgi:hypothetical protein